MKQKYGGARWNQTSNDLDHRFKVQKKIGCFNVKKVVKVHDVNLSEIKGK